MIATARELASRDVASHDVVNHDAVNLAEPDPTPCLAEFARVLHPAPLLLVAAANRTSPVRAKSGRTGWGGCSGKNGRAFLDYSHNEYAAADFCVLLNQHGFVTGSSLSAGPSLQWLQRRLLRRLVVGFLRCARVTPRNALLPGSTRSVTGSSNSTITLIWNYALEPALR
jgi:hypothetical protein